MILLLAILPHESCRLGLVESQESPLIPDTSKLVSVPQPQVQQGPTTRRTVWRSASWMENLGRKGCQVCSTWPMVMPGGDCTSIWTRRQKVSRQAGTPRPKLSLVQLCHLSLLTGLPIPFTSPPVIPLTSSPIPFPLEPASSWMLPHH